MKRIKPEIFKLPIDKIRLGYYSDKYFTRMVEILRKDKKNEIALYQFFSRSDGIVVGIDECISILKQCTGYYKDFNLAKKVLNRILKLDILINKNIRNKPIKYMIEKDNLIQDLDKLWINKWNEIKVKALFDGNKIKKNEPVLIIEGNPKYFAHLETVLLGSLSRASSTATAAYNVVKAAKKKPVLFFGSRFDHFWVQATDGYAVMKAGAFGVSTDSNGDYWGLKSMGTIPHALIGVYQGSTYEAYKAFDKHIHKKINRVVLVDWENDCIGTTLNLFKSLLDENKNKKINDFIGEGKGKIWAVRFDTSSSLKDKSVKSNKKFSKGVSIELIKKARKKFNEKGLKKLKIMVSGGFNEKKIRLYEDLKIPVDIYGVGSSLLKEKIDFTADLVKLNGKHCAKVGRKAGNFLRLKKVK